MDWQDKGIILSARPYGESGALVVALTAEHGRHAGLVYGGQSRGKRAGLEPGTLVGIAWRARLEDQLGTYLLEPERAFGSHVLDLPLPLAALASACSVAEAGLPEREPHPALFAGLEALLGALDGPVWAESYVMWEVGLLADLGFGLQLDQCALTGSTEDLAFVSPRSGRAVSRKAAEPYRARLLPLPGFLVGHGGGGEAEVLDGLHLTGHFLERHVFTRDNLGRGRTPAARARFVESYAAAAGAAIAGAGDLA